MITTNGKNIIAKYLLNQAPEFASHIAVGVGGQAYPTSSSAIFSNTAESLDFEVIRVPILSKGILKEGNEEKIVFKAELPPEQRYQITELALFPAERNLAAGNFDSKIISTFSNSEPWAYSNNGSISGNVLYIGDVPSDEINIGDINTASATWGDFVFVNSNSSIFEYNDRKNRGESPRYLDKSLSVAGDTSALSVVYPANLSLINILQSSYIQNNSISLNLGKSLPTDEIKLAFSVVSKARNGVLALPPDYVKIRLELLNSSNAKAYANIIVEYKDLESTRYHVATTKLSNFISTGDFSWSAINGIKIYTCVHDDSNNISGDYFVFYDGLRFENLSSYNPLYSLVAGEYVKTQDGSPVLKKENSSNYIEYRFGLGIS